MAKTLTKKQLMSVIGTTNEQGVEVQVYVRGMINFDDGKQTKAGLKRGLMPFNSTDLINLNVSKKGHLYIYGKSNELSNWTPEQIAAAKIKEDELEAVKVAKKLATKETRLAAAKLKNPVLTQEQLAAAAKLAGFTLTADTPVANQMQA